MNSKFSDLKSWLGDARHVQMLGLGVVATLLVLLILPVFATSSPGYFSGFGSLEKNHETLSTSSHEGIACNTCHVDGRDRITYRLALTADFYLHLVRKQDAPKFVKFPKPTREACLSCHETGWSDDIKRTSKIPHPAHMRVASEKRDCVKCHKWIAHEEIQMAKHKEMPFSGVCVAYGCHVGTKTSEECYSCHHVLDETAAKWRTDHPRIAQAAGANGCLETCHEAEQCRLCHTTGKRPTFTGLPTETGLKRIESLHTNSDWTKRHGSEAIKDQSKCMKCHVTDGECRACHTRKPSSHGATWIGQHKKVAENNEKRCLTCHKKSFCEDCHEQFKEMR